MKRFVVAYNDGTDTYLYDVSSNTWQQAIKQAILTHHTEKYIKEWLEDMPNTSREVQQYFYDCDSSIAWIEIT